MCNIMCNIARPNRLYSLLSLRKTAQKSGYLFGNRLIFRAVYET